MLTLGTANNPPMRQNSDNLTWTFDSDEETFNYFEKGEQFHPHLKHRYCNRR